jgi:hypothetical protein
LLVDTTSAEARNRALLASVASPDDISPAMPTATPRWKWSARPMNPHVSVWQESDRLVGKLHHAYDELDGKPLSERLELLRVRTGATELRGGPSACHAQHQPIYCPINRP